MFNHQIEQYIRGRFHTEFNLKFSSISWRSSTFKRNSSKCWLKRGLIYLFKALRKMWPYYITWFSVRISHGPRVDLSLPDHERHTPLYTIFNVSSELFDMDIRVQHLISSSANLSARKNVGRTPLLSACDNLRVPATVLETLIAAGADVHVFDYYGQNTATLTLTLIRYQDLVTVISDEI